MLPPVYHIWILLHTGPLSLTVVVFQLQITVAIVWKRSNYTSTIAYHHLAPIITRARIALLQLQASGSRPLLYVV
jgi:hypothetical protein